jgi:hypothetical protein
LIGKSPLDARDESFSGIGRLHGDGLLRDRPRSRRLASVSNPSRADLLKEGGIYPVVVPLGWKLIGPAGEDIAIQRVHGHPHHRILAQGALLATETARTEQPEVMTARRFALPGPVTPDILDRYSDAVVDALGKKGVKPRVDEKRIGICALSEEPCGKLVVSRLAQADGRMEIHFLVRDQKREPWELTYLIRQADVDRWRPLLEEIEGPLIA